IEKVFELTKAPKMGFLLHLLCLWISMLTMITYDTSMSWNAFLSILLFVAVKLLYRMYQWRHLT
ncbi:hypothetical protein PIB30_074092, partial [Stylosanthes scabra]|nr:hypothetical protein [Stylosanthes scabra]